MTLPGPDRARELLDGARGRRILVFGDLILDSYVWGGVERISPEAPVPVVRIERESARIGGAGNVARNLVSLGGQAVMVGVVGNDEEGRRLLSLMEKGGIEVSGVLMDPTRLTTGKTRVIAHQQQVVRIDREADTRVSEGMEESLAARLREVVRDCSAVIVEDYEKGVVDVRTIDALREAARAAEVPIYVDPKAREPELYRGARCLTPNRAEAAAMTGRRLNTVEQEDQAAASIMKRAESEAVLLTRGGEGMVLFEKGGSREEIPALGREVYDVTGAGDSVVAALALLASREGSLLEAAQLASCAAAVVVSHIGTYAPTVADVVEAARRLCGPTGGEA